MIQAFETSHPFIVIHCYIWQYFTLKKPIVSLSPSLFVSVFLSLCLSFSLSHRVSVRLSVWIYKYICVFLSLSLSDSLFLFCVHVSLSDSHSVSLCVSPRHPLCVSVCSLEAPGEELAWFPSTWQLPGTQGGAADGLISSLGVRTLASPTHGCLHRVWAGTRSRLSYGCVSIGLMVRERVEFVMPHCSLWMYLYVCLHVCLCVWFFSISGHSKDFTKKNKWWTLGLLVYLLACVCVILAVCMCVFVSIDKYMAADQL